MDEAGGHTFDGEAVAVHHAAAVTLVAGRSFAVFDRAGDCGGGVHGVFVGDTRVCSHLLVTVDGHGVEPLASHLDEPFRARFVGRTPFPSLVVRRDHHVGQGLHSDLRVDNVGRDRRQFVVQLHVGGDLAELFAVKEMRVDGTLARAVPTPDGLRMSRPGVLTGAMVRTSPAPVRIDLPDVLAWDVDLAPRASWSCCIEIEAVLGDVEVPVLTRVGGRPGHGHHDDADTGSVDWQTGRPELTSDVAGLDAAFVRTLHDLDALRIVDPSQPDDPVVAAGAPWFMTLFGRDSLLTAWMAIVLDPGLALSTVRVLARLQGRHSVPETEEQLGRILHEVRMGTAPSFALAEGSIYYGSADSTPLFVMLVHELWRWGVPLDDLRPVLPAVWAALAWMAGPGDPDGDGYIEYRRATPTGLANQGWKDSWDGVSFADGRLPAAPIALCEVQAYAYAAWVAGQHLATAIGDHVAASSYHARAIALRDSFHRDFWLPDREAFAIALDADKRPVDAVTSNMGHCLWAGIVDDDVAPAVVRWLTSPEMSSGWGVRTLATSMARYDPLSYHNGSVWPHDTALCIAGLRRTGFVDEALQLSTHLLAAATASEGRLPELFAGLGPHDLGVPVPYPASCSPQAWASAAPLLVLRALLGLEPDIPGGRVQLDPVLPGGASQLRLSGLQLGQGQVTIEVDGDAVAVRGLPRGISILRPAT